LKILLAVGALRWWKKEGPLEKENTNKKGPVGPVGKNKTGEKH